MALCHVTVPGNVTCGCTQNCARSMTLQQVAVSDMGRKLLGSEVAQFLWTGVTIALYLPVDGFVFTTHDTKFTLTLTSCMTRYSRKIIPNSGNLGNQNLDAKEVSHYKLMVAMTILI